MGKANFEGEPLLDPPIVDGSKIWIYFKDSQTKGWDFGGPGPPISLSNTSPDRPRLDFSRSAKLVTTGMSRILDRVTRKDLLQLSGRHAKFTKIQLDGHYLVAGYNSVELLILDLHQVILQ